MTKKRLMGFAKLTPEYRRELASLGGRAAHRNGTAHQFTSEEAREASRKGNESRRRKKEEQLAKQQNIGPIVVLKD